MEMRHLSHGFHAISNKDAGKLVGGHKHLPRDGYEKLIAYDGKHWWLARTRDGWRGVTWSVRVAHGWKLDDKGNAVSSRG